MRPFIRSVSLGALTLGGCGSERTGVDASIDSPSGVDASPDTSSPVDAGVDAPNDARPECGTTNFAEAGTCDPIPVCPADPPPSMQSIAKCQMSSMGPCGPLYKVLVDCTRKYTACSKMDCKTDSVLTGQNLLQNCASQQMNHADCVAVQDAGSD